MSLSPFMFSRERLVLVNHFEFPLMEAENALDSGKPGRELGSLSFIIPITILLDGIRAELENKNGRWGWGRAGRDMI